MSAARACDGSAVLTLIEADDQIGLRLHVALVLRRELAANVDTLLVGGERPRPIAPLQLHVADLVEAHRQVALRLRIALVLRREPAGNVEALLVGGDQGNANALRGSTAV